MEKDKEEVIEHCPIEGCEYQTKGNIAPYNIKQHVEKYHPKEYKEWLRSLGDNKPKIQTKPQATNVVLQPIYNEPPPQATNEPPQATRPLPVYKGQLEPDEWLRQFLSSYKFKPTFVDTMAHYVKYRQQLPAGAQLTQDIKDMDSGISNLRHAGMIAEIYENELRQYMTERTREVEAANRPYQGVPLNQWGQPQPQQQGWNVPNQNPNQQGYQGVPINPWYPNQQQQYQQQFPQYMQQDRIARLEDQLRIRDEDARRKQEQEMMELKMQLQQYAQGPQRDPYMERMEAKMDMMEVERARKQDEEMQIMKLQIQRGGLSPQDVQQMIAAERGKITGDDIRRMIDQAMTNKGGLSETELKYAESKDKFKLEEMKLHEQAKTRDTIANAVKGGFASVGSAIARTAQEVGSEKQTPVVGRYDGEHTWQLNCPSCNGMITAPISARVVSCPSCGGDFEVLPQQPDQPPPQQRTAGFTVEHDIDPIQPVHAEPPHEYSQMPLRAEPPHEYSQMPLRAEPPKIVKEVEPVQDIKIQTTMADHRIEDVKITEPTPTRIVEPPKRKSPTALERTGNNKQQTKKPIKKIKERK